MVTKASLSSGKRSAKRQTRLSLAPLSSSPSQILSSQATRRSTPRIGSTPVKGPRSESLMGYHEGDSEDSSDNGHTTPAKQAEVHTLRKLAAVIYSPARRGLRNNPARGAMTPGNSSQSRIRSGGKKRRTPMADASRTASDVNPISLDSLSRATPPTSSAQEQARIPLISLDSDEAPNTPMNPMRNHKPSSDAVDTQSTPKLNKDMPGAQDEETPTRRVTRSGGKRRVTYEDEHSDLTDDSVEKTPTRRVTKSSGKRRVASKDVSTAFRDDGVEEQPRSAKKIRIDSRSGADEKLIPLTNLSSDDEGSVDVIDPVTMTPQSLPHNQDPTLLPDQRSSPPSPLFARGIIKKQSAALKEDSDDEDDDEGEDVRPTPRRRRLVQRALAYSPRRNSSQIDEDLRSDMEVLKRSKIVGSRTRQRGPAPNLTEKQKRLAQLRRRHAPGPVSAADLSDTHDSGKDGEAACGLYDSSHGSTEADGEENGSDGENDGSAVDEISRMEQIRQSLRHGARDQYDEDFVVEGDDDTLGAPDCEAMASIPIEFTRHAHKKPKEHFRDAVEWMVHNKLNPAFDRKAPVYQVAVKRLDMHVQAYATSKFTSSTWRSDFIRALRARPSLWAHEIDTQSGGRCEACNRSNHPPSWTVQFQGSPYHRDTLEHVADDDDDDDDDVNDDKEGGGEGSTSDDSDNKSVDSMGRPLASRSKKWAIGRFCKANAETSHALQHWRYELNQWVLHYLKQIEVTSPEAILTRESWSQRRKQKYADEIMEEMTTAGEIKGLYRDFKSTLDAAENHRQTRYG